jgi:hypothetical protein
LSLHKSVTARSATSIRSVSRELTQAPPILNNL